MTEPYRILAAVSLDETGDWALFEGLRLARGRPDAELHVVHVVEGSVLTDPGDVFRDTDERLADAPNKVRRRIERFWLEEASPETVLGHFRLGAAAPMILRLAVDIAADIIVVGSHRSTLLRRWFSGSVSEAVARGAHCPVLIAMPKSYEGAESSELVERSCTDCDEVRRASGDALGWCERHRRDYHEPHVYTARPSARSNILSTY